MNPVDQLMQSFGGTPSSAIAGLLGISPASNAAEGSATELFATTLQGIQTTAEASDAAPEGLLSAEFVPPLDIAAFGATISAEDNPSFNLKAFLGLPNDTPASAVFAQLGQEITLPENAPVAPGGAALSNLVANTADMGAGEKGLATAQANGLPMVPAAKLEQLGLKLEQLPALPSGKEIAEISGAGTTASSHIIPENIIANADVPSAPQAMITSAPVTEKAPVEALPLTGAHPAATSKDAGSNLVVPASPQAGEVTAPTAPSGTSDLADDAVPQQAVNAPTLATAAAAATVSGLRPTQESGEAQAASEQQPDGHVVASAQQAATNQQRSPSQASSSNKASSTGNATGKQSGSSHTAAAANASATSISDAAKDLGSAKPIEPVSMRSDAPPPPMVAKETPQPLTPERLSGFMDSTAASTVASGLPGLRGESSFLSSMSLMGGRANPEFAQHVGQQLNMQVTKAINAGQQEFTVRLDPAELGRVQVKLSFDKNGGVQTRVLVERPETLELLQKDTKGLERAITAAGHKADGGIQFSLDSNNEQSAGRAFAEAVQQEKMRDELAARSGINSDPNAFAGTVDEEEIVPLDEILANVSVETGLDISV